MKCIGLYNTQCLRSRWSLPPQISLFRICFFVNNYSIQFRTCRSFFFYFNVKVNMRYLTQLVYAHIKWQKKTLNTLENLISFVNTWKNACGIPIKSAKMWQRTGCAHHKCMENNKWNGEGFFSYIIYIFLKFRQYIYDISKQMYL